MNKTFEQTITKTYSIADIYGICDPKIPEGYEAVEFRLVKEGDFWLSVVIKTSADGPAWFTDSKETDEPRIILRKSPTPKDFYGVDDPKIPEGYKSLGFRKVKPGDTYLSGFNRWEPGLVPSSVPLKAESYSFAVGSYRIIVEKLPPKQTIESTYGTPDPAIPEGWEKVDFRIPEMEEYFLDASARRAEMRFVRDWESVTGTGNGSRIILRKKNREVPDCELLDYVLNWIWKEVPADIVDGGSNSNSKRYSLCPLIEGDASNANVKTWKSSIREMLSLKGTQGERV